MLISLRHFLARNRFALAVAGLWLALVWGLVIAAQLYHHQPVSLAAWAAMWDGGWYRSIIEHGYYNAPPLGQVNLAFFPLLPILAQVLSAVTLLPVVWAGIVVSSLCFAAALAILHKLVTRQFGAPTAKWTLLLLAFNPFSFYFGMLYTESLFLLLAVLVFWFLLQRQWWLAAGTAGLATATRSVGAALALTVLVAWAWENRSYLLQPGQMIRLAGIGLLGMGGLLAFSAYLWVHTGDPVAYMHAQQFWPGRGGFNNVAAELTYLAQAKDINLEYVITLMWYISAAIGFMGLVLVIKGRQWLMAVFAATALALPIIFGTASAMNRYVQVVFPMFIAYACLLQTQNRLVKGLVIACGVVGMAIALLFLVGPRKPFLG